MEPKKRRSKTVAFIVVIVVVLAGLGFYYVTAIMNSDNRPATVERAS